MLIFHENCQSLGQVKMENLPCNTPLFLVLWPHPEPSLRLKEENLRLRFMGNEKCLWTPKRLFLLFKLFSQQQRRLAY